MAAATAPTAPTAPIDRLSPGRHNYGDGLSLIVQRSGTRSWSLRLSHGGKQRSFGLGAWPEVSEHQARLNAKARRDLVAAGLPASQARMPTFGQACEEVFRHRLRDHKRAAEQEAWMAMMRRYCRWIWDLPADQVGRTDVLDVLRPVLHKSSVWRKVRTGVKQVIGTVMGQFEHMRENPAEAISETLRMEAPRRRVQHYRALPWQEVPAFVEALRQQRTGTRPALLALTLTALRVNEIRQARWQELDWDAAVLTIPPERMKTSEPFRVPLSAQAVAVVAGCRVRAAALDSPYVFASGRHPAPGDPVTANAMRHVVNQTGYDTSLHGLRSAFRGWALEHGVDWVVAETCLSHRIGSEVSRAYTHGTDLLDRRREVMQRWANYCFSDVAN